MSERTTLTGNGEWTQIGTGPATVQLLSVGVEVMIVVSSTEPTGSDGLVLYHTGDTYTATLSDAIWAQVVQSGATAIVAVQPEAS